MSLWAKMIYLEHGPKVDPFATDLPTLDFALLGGAVAVSSLRWGHRQPRDGARKPRKPAPPFRLFVERVIDLLCVWLVRGHSSLDTFPVPVLRRGLADWLVTRVTDFMRDNLDRTIGLAELAALVDLSRFHFCTAIGPATGRTAYQWLTRLGIDRARWLLADPTLSVTDVALAVGYERSLVLRRELREDHRHHAEYLRHEALVFGVPDAAHGGDMLATDEHVRTKLRLEPAILRACSTTMPPFTCPEIVLSPGKVQHLSPRRTFGWRLPENCR
jgi:AraC-like DNA-binding protein